MAHGWGDRRLGRREHVGGVAQVHDVDGALGALGQVRLEASALVVVEHVEHVGRGEGVEILGHQVTSNWLRMRMRPVRIRVLMVPSGTSSVAATSR